MCNKYIFRLTGKCADGIVEFKVLPVTSLDITSILKLIDILYIIQPKNAHQKHSLA